MQDRARVHEPFAGIERLGLAHRLQILFGIFVGDPERVYGEPGPGCERLFIGRRAIERRQWSLAEIAGRCDRLRWRRGAPGDTNLAVALDAQLEPGRALG